MVTLAFTICFRIRFLNLSAKEMGTLASNSYFLTGLGDNPEKSPLRN